MPPLSQFTARALPPALTDIFGITVDPAGSPLQRKLSFADLFFNSEWSLGVHQASVVQTVFGLGAVNTLQNALPAAQDTITLPANTTYYFEGQYILATGSTSHTTAMEFLAGDGLTITSCNYYSWAWAAAANAIATTSWSKWNTGIGTNVVTAAGTPVRTHIQFLGVIRVNVGGTLTPRIQFSANPTGTNQMLVDSFVGFRRIGAGNFANHAAWA